MHTYLVCIFMYMQAHTLFSYNPIYIHIYICIGMCMWGYTFLTPYICIYTFVYIQNVIYIMGVCTLPPVRACLAQPPLSPLCWQPEHGQPGLGWAVQSPQHRQSPLCQQDTCQEHYLKAALRSGPSCWGFPPFCLTFLRGSQRGARLSCLPTSFLFIYFVPTVHSQIHLSCSESWTAQLQGINPSQISKLSWVLSKSKLGALQLSENDYWYTLPLEQTRRLWWVSFPGQIYTTAQSPLVYSTQSNAKILLTFVFSSNTHHCWARCSIDWCNYSCHPLKEQKGSP